MSASLPPASDVPQPASADAGDPNAAGLEAGGGAELPRRDFLRIASAGTGALLAGAALTPAALDAQPQPPRGIRRRFGRASGHVVVVGAGAWGAFTAYHLRQQGMKVTLVDQYGIANSRATSGDETRGIRSSYGDRTVTADLWVRWARRSIDRWRQFDAEHGKRFGTRFFYTTGDVIIREKPEPFTTRTAELWTAQGVPFETLTADEARRRWPQFVSEGSQVVLYEPDAGVARARDSVQAVGALARDAGVEFKLGRIRPGAVTAGKMEALTFDDGSTLAADAYVFCCGPWFPKLFPSLMQTRMRIPMGHVCYFGTPEGDTRFQFPNIPSWNVPGVTGWPSHPIDNRGFRVRGAFAPPAPPRAADDDAPPPPAPVAPDPRLQDPDLSPRWSSQERIDGSRRVLQKHFPALADAPIVETRSCHYESSVNRNFIVDRLPGADNAWIAGVGQAEGFKFSIVMGEYVASRVIGEPGDAVIAEAFRLPTAEYDPAAPSRWEEE
jgi:glycine/D-amino acid oxidase-like deaminating enzyme